MNRVAGQKKLSFFKKIELDRDLAVTNMFFFVTVLFRHSVYIVTQSEEEEEEEEEFIRIQWIL